MADGNSEQKLVNFCLSKDLNLRFQFKLISLSGWMPALNEVLYSSKLQGHDLESQLLRSKLETTDPIKHTLIVHIFIESDAGSKLTAPVVKTINYSSKLTTGIMLDNKHDTESEWIKLPIVYSKLPLDSKMVIKFFGMNIIGKRIFLGHTSLDLFDSSKSCTLISGYQRLQLQLNEQINKNSNKDESVSPGTKKLADKLSFLEDQVRRKKNGELPNVDWLDQMTRSKIDQMNKDETNRLNEYLGDIPNEEIPDNGSIFMILELMRFKMPIVYSDVKYAPFIIPSAISSEDVGLPNKGTQLKEFNQVTYDNRKSFQHNPSNRIFDPEQYRTETSEDPIEYKFRKLERAHQLSSLDRDIKPTSKVRSKLDQILKKQFFEKLTQQEKNLIWKFRFFLLNSLVVGGSNEQYNNFIINFIKCIDWDDSFEVNEFLNILKDLDSKSGGTNLFIQELTIVDCLELLSAMYKNKIVRDMAIQRLNMASDDELELFMVQLVQSIKYEQTLIMNEELPDSNPGKFDDFVDEFEGRLKSPTVNNDYQVVEHKSDEFDDATMQYLYSSRVFTLSKTGIVPHVSTPLSDFIIQRALKDPALANFFYWNVRVQLDEENSKNAEKEEEISGVVTLVGEDNSTKNGSENTVNSTGYPKRLQHNHLYERIMLTFISELATADEEGKGRISDLRRQVELVRQLHRISLKIKLDYKKEQTKKKVEILQRLLKEKHRMSILGGKDISTGTKARSGTATSALEAMGLSISNRLASTHLTSDETTDSQNDEEGEESREDSEHIHSTRSNTGSSISSSSISAVTSTSSPRKHHNKKTFGLIDYESMLSFPEIQIPLDPKVAVWGAIPEHCKVFKSSLSPLKVSFKSNTPSGEYPVMYKVGDDLRQDQFVIQIISLMDKILESENLDLKLTPYRILATAPVEGLIQFVPNSSLSSILSKFNNSILAYLQRYNPDPSAPHGVKADVMDTYVRSCAGYCVITYILGVGDRHLENLLLTKDGYFFHADFGYILGADPKPFPPLMKLPIQVIEGMGGLDDENYQKFCNYCFITYLTLRRNASIILNLFQLMINTPIPALRTMDENSESEKMELIWKVQEKFMLNLDDEGAVLHFQRLIDDSVNAVYPVMIDRLHSMAQYWRS